MYRNSSGIFSLSFLGCPGLEPRCSCWGYPLPSLLSFKKEKKKETHKYNGLHDFKCLHLKIKSKQNVSMLSLGVLGTKHKSMLPREPWGHSFGYFAFKTFQISHFILYKVILDKVFSFALNWDDYSLHHLSFIHKYNIKLTI